MSVCQVHYKSHQLFISQDDVKKATDQNMQTKIMHNKHNKPSADKRQMKTELTSQLNSVRSGQLLSASLSLSNTLLSNDIIGLSHSKHRFLFMVQKPHLLLTHTRVCTLDLQCMRCCSIVSTRVSHTLTPHVHCFDNNQ